MHFYHFQRFSDIFANIAYSNVAQRVRRALFLEAASRARRAGSACTERPKRSNSQKLWRTSPHWYCHFWQFLKNCLHRRLIFFATASKSYFYKTEERQAGCGYTRVWTNRRWSTEHAERTFCGDGSVQVRQYLC